MNKIIFADCEVLYDGRAKSKLERGRYLIVLKPDNSVLIHGNRLITPINYLGTKSTIIESANIITCTKNNEQIEIIIHNIIYEFEPKGWSSNRANLTGSEKELVLKFVSDVQKVFPTCSYTQINYPSDYGPVDIYGVTEDGIVIIEAKRKKISLNVCWQLSRYLECFPGAKGYLLGPDISTGALKRCKESGYKFIKYTEPDSFQLLDT